MISDPPFQKGLTEPDASPLQQYGGVTEEKELCFNKEKAVWVHSCAGTVPETWVWCVCARCVSHTFQEPHSFNYFSVCSKKGPAAPGMTARYPAGRGTSPAAAATLPVKRPLQFKGIKYLPSCSTFLQIIYSRLIHI